MFQLEEESFSDRHKDLKTIMIVENDEDIGEMMKLVLSEEPGYYPFLVSTPQSARNAVRSLKAHLVLIDYHLPEMNGIQLCDLLRQIEGVGSIPVIIMSAGLERHEHELADRDLVGLSKPFSIEELLTLVRQAFTK